MKYKEAQAILDTARDPVYAGKPLENETRMYRRGRNAVVEHYGTRVVTIRPDGRFVLRNNGWTSQTTNERIRAYSPAYPYTVTGTGSWYLNLRPDPDDPRPEWPEREIPKPFDAPADPGGEPVKSSDGCLAGQRIETHHENETIDRVYRKNLLDDDKVLSVDFRHGPSNYDYDTLTVQRTWTDAIVYGETSYDPDCRDRYVSSHHDSRPRRPDGERYEICPHCKDFEAEHDRWTTAMQGYRYCSLNERKGFANYTALIDKYGSRKAWQEAYITEFRQVRADRKSYREWEERNRVKFFDGVVVDKDGYPTAKSVAANKPMSARKWCKLHGLTPNRDNKTVTLFKATDSGYMSNNGAVYTPGAVVKAKDYKPTPECGQGLHFGPTPDVAKRYHYGERVTVLTCKVPLKTLVPLDDKCKADSCRVIEVIQDHVHPDTRF